MRRIQREMMRKRMLSAVKTATVVVTNPTHFAVALHYNHAEMVAPIAWPRARTNSRSASRKWRASTTSRPWKTLRSHAHSHKSSEVGDTIPAALFGAVAEVLAYLVRLKQLVL